MKTHLLTESSDVSLMTEEEVAAVEEGRGEQGGAGSQVEGVCQHQETLAEVGSGKQTSAERGDASFEDDTGSSHVAVAAERSLSVHAEVAGRGVGVDLSSNSPALERNSGDKDGEFEGIVTEASDIGRDLDRESRGPGRAAAGLRTGTSGSPSSSPERLRSEHGDRAGLSLKAFTNSAPPRGDGLSTEDVQMALFHVEQLFSSSATELVTVYRGAPPMKPPPRRTLQ